MNSIPFDLQKVLVLNKSWVPVAVASLQRAITLLFSFHETGVYAGQPKAKIIDPTKDFQTFTWSDWSRIKPQDGDNVIRGVDKEFRIPEVVMLTEYDKNAIQKVNFSRRMLWKRDQGRCQYCGINVGNEGTIDHVIPKSQGGKTTWTNTILACVACNSQKADRTPEMAFRQKKDKNWRGPSPMKCLSIPKKPKFTLLKGDRNIFPKSWKNFLSEMYWRIELENDNDSIT